MNLSNVLDDALGHVPFGLERLHGASRFLDEVLEPRELGEHVIDHGLLLADAFERDLHVAQDVRDAVGLPLDGVDELAATLNGDDLFLRTAETVAQAIQLGSSLAQSRRAARRWPRVRPGS